MELCTVCVAVYSEWCLLQYVVLCAVCGVCTVNGAVYSVWCCVQCVVLCTLSGAR